MVVRLQAYLYTILFGHLAACLNVRNSGLVRTAPERLYVGGIQTQHKSEGLYLSYSCV